MNALRSPTIISPSIIGRDPQLARLTHLVTQVRGGQSPIALVAGEEGIGKSRLVAEVAAIAEQHGARIVQARCFEHDRGLPYAPLIDLLRAFSMGRSADELARTLGSSATELVKIFPELSG